MSGSRPSAKGALLRSGSDQQRHIPGGSTVDVLIGMMPLADSLGYPAADEAAVGGCLNEIQPRRG
jgi:hypothetical protein